MGVEIEERKDLERGLESLGLNFAERDLILTLRSTLNREFGRFSEDQVLILLVGSTVNGRTEKNSDIDIRISFYSEEPDQRKTSFMKAQALLSDSLKTIMHQQVSGVSEEVLKNGWGGWRLVEGNIIDGDSGESHKDKFPFLEYGSEPARFLTAQAEDRRPFDIFVTSLDEPAAEEHRRNRQKEGKKEFVILDTK